MTTSVRTRVACAVIVLLATVWFVAPARRGMSIDVEVYGDGSVAEARDEIGRRFRQEGLVVEVHVVPTCDQVPTTIQRLAVLSFRQWDDCDTVTLERAALLVVQPGGVRPPVGRVRDSEALFGADRVPCLWWDTPGAGEERPGLGRCEFDGLVTVIERGHLTPAGAERFARLLVEAIR